MGSDLLDYIAMPFAWLLRTLYSIFANYGVAIIFFTLIVKLILLPFQMKSKRSMMRSSRLTPRLKELEKKYEGNKQKYQEEVSRIYKEEKINPMSGCLWSLIPFPILIALYRVIRQPLTSMMGLAADQVTQITDKLTSMGVYDAAAVTGETEIALTQLVSEHYDTIHAIVPEVINLDYSFLGLNLGQTPQWNFFLTVDWSDPSSWLPAFGLFLIPVLSGALSFFSMKISQRDSAPAQDQQGSMKGMMYMMPLVSVFIGFAWPAALGLYWAVQSVFSIIQDALLSKVYKKQLDAEDDARVEKERAREAELEEKRRETEMLRAAGATERNRNTSKRKIQTTQKAKEEERQAAERSAKRALEGTAEDTPASKVGRRKFARGRNYNPERFGGEFAPESDFSSEEETGERTDVAGLIHGGVEAEESMDTADNEPIEKLAGDDAGE